MINSPPPSVASTEKDKRQTRIVIAMLFGGFSTFAQLYCMQSLLPLLSEHFSITPSHSSWAVSAATLALGFGLLFASVLAEGVSRKYLMGISLLLSSLFTISLAFTSSFNALIVLSAMKGLALAGLPAIAMTYLSEEVSPNVLARIMGLYIGGNIFGGMTGRVIVAWLADWTSWRVAIGATGIICLLMAIAFIRLLPASQNFQPGRIHFTRSLHFALRHLRDPTLISLYIFIGLAMGTFISVYNYLGFHLSQPPFDLPHWVIGTIFSMYLVGIVGSFSIGSISDRIGKHRVLWILTTTMLAGLLLMLFKSIFWIVLGLAVFTFSFFGMHTIASSWVGRHTPEGRAIAVTLYLFVYYIGSSLIGSSSGVVMHRFDWPGLIGALGAALSIALCLALFLNRLQRQEIKAVRNPVHNPDGHG